MTPADARPTGEPQAAAASGPTRSEPRNPEPRSPEPWSPGPTGPEMPGDREMPTGPETHGGPESGTGPESGGSTLADVRTPWQGWDPLLRVAGVVVSILATFLSGVLEVLLSTLRAGDVVTVWRGDPIGSGSGPLLGFSILLAIAGNVGIGWFAVSTTRRRWALGPPWALWTLLMLFASGVRTNEGDYLLGGDNWVALVMILAGSLSFAVFAYRMILKGIPGA